MIRFLLSFIILALLITYAIIPVVKHFKALGEKEAKRIDKAFTKTFKITPLNYWYLNEMWSLETP